MGTKRYIIRPAYHYRPEGRRKFYLVYDLESPSFLENEAIQPNWILDGGEQHALNEFIDDKGIDREEIKLDVARVLKDSEAERYLSAK